MWVVFFEEGFSVFFGMWCYVYVHVPAHSYMPYPLTIHKWMCANMWRNSRIWRSQFGWGTKTQECSTHNWGPLHTWDQEPVTIPLQALLHTTLEGPTEYVSARCMQCLHGFLHGIEWIMFHGYLDCSLKLSLGGKPDTKPIDHGTPNTHNCFFILFYHMWGPSWIEIRWNNICLRVPSHMTSYYTWGYVTTLHEFGGVLGWHLDTFFWALTIHGHGSWLVCEVAMSLG